MEASTPDGFLNMTASLSSEEHYQFLSATFLLTNSLYPPPFLPSVLTPDLSFYSLFVFHCSTFFFSFWVHGPVTRLLQTFQFHLLPPRTRRITCVHPTPYYKSIKNNFLIPTTSASSSFFCLHIYEYYPFMNSLNTIEKKLCRTFSLDYEPV